MTWYHLRQKAFDKDYNDCKSLVSPELTKKQKKQIHDNMEKSKLVKMKYTLEDIKEINPVSWPIEIQIDFYFLWDHNRQFRSFMYVTVVKATLTGYRMITTSALDEPISLKFNDLCRRWE